MQWIFVVLPPRETPTAWRRPVRTRFHLIEKRRHRRRVWAADAADSAVFFVAIGLLLAGRGWFGLESSVISGAVIGLL